MDDYKEDQRESQTGREHDEWEQLGEDETVDYRDLRHFGKDEELEKETDY